MSNMIWTCPLINLNKSVLPIGFLLELDYLSKCFSPKGVSVDVGGYYKLDEDKANAVMRPSKKFNELMDVY